MKKVRSESLYLYLKEQGVLESTPEVIEEAKRNYRRKYVQAWKRNRPKLRKEIRYSVTQKQYFELKVRAIESGLLPTEFAKDSMLSSVANKPNIPNRQMLESILQSIGIATSLCQHKDRYGNISPVQVEQYLLKAETALLKYLKDK